SPALQDRLYLNDGRGNFRKAPAGSLPAETVSGSRAAAADFDGDGAIDLFIGGRVVPWRYGLTPRSTLLRNDGRGHFTDVTAKFAPGLAQVGMVTDALWRDVTGDGRPDLVVVGEWMPITIFRNTGHSLERMEVPGLARSNGWWNRIVAGDFDGDGRVDFVVGNLGLNTRLQASEREPVTMYVKDFLKNGFVEQIIASYNGGSSYPFVLRDDLIGSLPYLRPRFASYHDYAGKSMSDIFSKDDLAGAEVRTAYTFATSLVHNDGNGKFTVVPLPTEAQLAPVYGILARDFNGDGKLDLLLAGNFNGVKPEIGRMAASYGLYLEGTGKGTFTPVRAAESGFFVPGESRDIERLGTPKGELYVVTRNDARALVFRPAGKR
ncbi:MAG TPA: VCBS repeat-containing protein, partial [Gemmatimonadaceae bacterium]|nr:VCBS repeat-containing protein [Gemmatimonadaceae bacterium]